MSDNIETIRKLHADKFASLDAIFGHIHLGDTIFIGTGCSEPQYLVRSLIEYVRSHPKALTDSALMQVWSLGVAPYADEKFKGAFRHNSFFIGHGIRDAVNKGMADYTPVFLSRVPDLIRNRRIPIDAALIQTSMPDEHGYMSLGISVDIVKAAVECADLIIAQVNSNMPRVHGDGFLHIADVDYIVPFDEPLLTFAPSAPDDIANRIGTHVARLIRDGDTIQVGYGSIPNAILKNLMGKRDLGIHTELLTDGIVELIKSGVVTNRIKNINRGKTIASFSMGSKSTYEFLHDNPTIEFKTVDYTNNPLVIAKNDNMIAINSALEIDLTGQATAESIGQYFYSGIGGQADFMRGAVLSQGGKTILAIQSTANNGKTSRIVPALKTGAGVTLNRGDLHYVATEYGLAYIHGKNVRERAMSLIAIAHPKFRQWLIDEAKGHNLIYIDQAFLPGERGMYPESLTARRTTRAGLTITLRPVKIDDEGLLKEFFYDLSSDCMYSRFISSRADMPHERLQKLVVIDYSKEMVILAVTGEEGKESIAGMGQYYIDERTHTAEVALVVMDDMQKKGVGMELLSHLTLLAKNNGLLGFTAEVLMDNTAMLKLFERMGFKTEKRAEEGVYELNMRF